MSEVRITHIINGRKTYEMDDDTLYVPHPFEKEINGISWEYDTWKFKVDGRRLKEVHPGNFDGKPFEGYCWAEDVESTPQKCTVYSFSNKEGYLGWYVLLDEDKDRPCKENWLLLVDHVAIAV